MLSRTRFVLGPAMVFAIIALAAMSGSKAQHSEGTASGGSSPGLITSVPRTMSYQGVLNDSDGDPVRNTTLNITFRVFDADEGGSQLWTEVVQVTTDQRGNFKAILGETNPLNLSFDVNYYLELQIEGDPQPLEPRQKLHMAAYAARADTANNAIPADNSVSQIKLKTAWGEVSRDTYPLPIVISVLPGGEYGFYPQIRGETATNGRHSASILGTSGMDAFIPPTSYTTTICLRAEGTRIYARQRYVTSSGRDHWIFFLIDKATSDVLASYQAPDHPCYGSGGDENDIPHPFLNFDPKKQQVILIDNKIVPELKAKANSRRSLLAVINEEYEIDFDSKPIYIPREIIEIDEYGDKNGEILQKIKTPEWAKILIERDEIYLKKRLVKTLPHIISYKKLKPKFDNATNIYTITQSTVRNLP